MKTCRFIVMRHGESTHNVTQLYNSHPEHPRYQASFLTQQGIAEVKKTCEHLSKTGITKNNVVKGLVSPLPRTIQTAAFLIEKGIIAPERLEIDHRLTERGMGDKEGTSWAQEDPWDDTAAASYHGEIHQHLKNRLVALLKDVDEKYPEGTVLFVTHGSPAQMLIEIYLHTVESTSDFRLPPAGFMCLE